MISLEVVSSIGIQRDARMRNVLIVLVLSIYCVCGGAFAFASACGRCTSLPVEGNGGDKRIAKCEQQGRSTLV